MNDDIKTIDQLCARDLGRRVRVATGEEVVEGALGHVRQYGKKESRFALFSLNRMYEIQVGSIRLAGMAGKTEVEFL